MWPKVCGHPTVSSMCGFPSFPSLRLRGPNVSQHDNAPVHKARSMTTCHVKVGAEELKSPDLNPPEPLISTWLHWSSCRWAVVELVIRPKEGHNLEWDATGVTVSCPHTFDHIVWCVKPLTVNLIQTQKATPPAERTPGNVSVCGVAAFSLLERLLLRKRRWRGLMGLEDVVETYGGDWKEWLGWDFIDRRSAQRLRMVNENKQINKKGPYCCHPLVLHSRPCRCHPEPWSMKSPKYK